MKVKIWQDTDYVERDVPDELLRPMVEAFLGSRDWDRHLPRLYRLVRDTKLNVADWQLREAAAAEAAKAPPKPKATKAHAPA